MIDNFAARRASTYGTCLGGQIPHITNSPPQYYNRALFLSLFSFWAILERHKQPLERESLGSWRVLLLFSLSVESGRSNDGVMRGHPLLPEHSDKYLIPSMHDCASYQTNR